MILRMDIKYFMLLDTISSRQNSQQLNSFIIILLASEVTKNLFIPRKEYNSKPYLSDGGLCSRAVYSALCVSLETAS